eukprot:2560287-Alexandrium_andersonii.AAC.1
MLSQGEMYRYLVVSSRFLEFRVVCAQVRAVSHAPWRILPLQQTLLLPQVAIAPQKGVLGMSKTGPFDLHEIVSYHVALLTGV